MLTCSSCQASIGGFHEVYARLCLLLIPNEKCPETQLKLLEKRHPTTEGKEELKAIEYLIAYYTWAVDTHAGVQEIMGVTTLVARALLDPLPCTSDRLPYFSQDREKDGQRNILDVSLCCVRMLATSPRLHQLLLLHHLPGNYSFGR